VEGHPVLSLVVVGALGRNTVIAVSIGGTLLLLRVLVSIQRLHQDRF
jgi:hypothetical protein